MKLFISFFLFLYMLIQLSMWCDSFWIIDVRSEWSSESANRVQKQLNQPVEI